MTGQAPAAIVVVRLKVGAPVAALATPIAPTRVVLAPRSDTIPILVWVALTTTVGLALRALEERFGALGKLLGFVIGLGWAAASFFAISVIVAEGLGPIDAVKRSGEVIRQTWGTSLRTTLRFGFIQFLATIPCIAAMVIGIMVASTGSAAAVALGIALLVAGIIGLVALAVLASAVTTYARALIFRYATGRPVPGVADGLLGGAFMVKGRRWS